MTSRDITKARILEHLTRHPEGDTTASMADALGLTVITLRRAISCLHLEGKVTRERAPKTNTYTYTRTLTLQATPSVTERLPAIRAAFADPIVELDTQQAAELIPGCTPVTLHLLVAEGYLLHQYDSAGDLVFRRAANA